ESSHRSGHCEKGRKLTPVADACQMTLAHMNVLRIEQEPADILREFRMIEDFGQIIQKDGALLRFDAREFVLDRQFEKDVGRLQDRRPGADHALRSEERRVGKECRSRWSPYR